MSPTFSVSDFVASLNQTFEYAYNSVVIVGELSNLRVSKGKWIYFDLKDENASVKFFGTVYMMPGPLEDGMIVQVTGTPRMHPAYGFSVTAQSITPMGAGSIKKAAALLRAKLTQEGLFAEERKRSIAYPPTRIGLIASGESAAYVDFMKILNARWGGIEIFHIDVQVQGESAPGQIVAAIEKLNTETNLDAIIITRGGGSADDLIAFNVEQVVRAIAASRIPTLVAIGHERDESLAELAADKRASTPSNAAELLTPDRSSVKAQYRQALSTCTSMIHQNIVVTLQNIVHDSRIASMNIQSTLDSRNKELVQARTLLESYDPRRVLRLGYAQVRLANGNTVISARMLHEKADITLRFNDGIVDAEVKKVSVSA